MYEYKITAAVKKYKVEQKNSEGMESQTYLLQW